MKPAAIGSTRMHEDLTDSLHVCYYDLSSDTSYMSAFSKLIEEGSHVILDWGPELKRNQTLVVDYLSTAREYDFRGTVLPSVDYNKKATVELIKQTYSDVKRPIGVIQGRTIEELVECCEGIESLVSAIGMTTSAENILQRSKLATLLPTDKPLILIECMDFMVHERPMSPKIKLAWSAVPFLLALEGKGIKEKAPFNRTFRPSQDEPPPMLTKNLTDYSELWYCA